MAFTLEERLQLGIHGLLPPCFLSQDVQVLRVLRSYETRTNPLDKWVLGVSNKRWSHCSCSISSDRPAFWVKSSSARPIWCSRYLSFSSCNYYSVWGHSASLWSYRWYIEIWNQKKNHLLYIYQTWLNEELHTSLLVHAFTYLNSTNPCVLLTGIRIKMVLKQLNCETWTHIWQFWIRCESESSSMNFTRSVLSLLSNQEFKDFICSFSFTITCKQDRWPGYQNLWFLIYFTEWVKTKESKMSLWHTDWIIWVWF